MSILIALGLGVIPSVIWLTFFEQEDRKHPEGLRNIIFAFVIGAFTTFAALLVQLLINKFLLANGIATRSPIGVTIFAAVEEILKFLAVFFLIRRKKFFDEPLDAMIYMITVALGFAAVENVASAINHGNLLQGAALLKSLETLTLRFLGATLLHSVTSAIAGFHWAVGLVTRKYLAGHIAAGVFIAVLLHAVFNYLIIRTGPVAWAIPFVIAIAFFVLIDFEKLKRQEGL